MPAPVAVAARSLALATVITTAVFARRLVVSDGEARVFRSVNRAPGSLAVPAWIVTQGGSLGAVFVAADITRRRRGRGDGATVLCLGAGVWAGAKIVKPLVGRGRPAEHLDGVVVRGQAQRGLGFPSGHAAVSMTLALAGTFGRARIPAVAVAMLTGCCRLYSGAHLPLDVAGGAAIGVLAGTLRPNRS